jgi:hypothetical protein
MRFFIAAPGQRHWRNAAMKLFVPVGCDGRATKERPVRLLTLDDRAALQSAIASPAAVAGKSR